jgi:hypothetical protein
MGDRERHGDGSEMFGESRTDQSSLSTMVTLGCRCLSMRCLPLHFSGLARSFSLPTPFGAVTKLTCLMRVSKSK